MGTLHENQYTFMLFRLILLTMGNVPDKSFRKNHKTHFMFSNLFPEIMPFTRFGKNMVQPDMPPDDNVIQRMRFACRITKARIHTYIHTLIIFLRHTSFPRRQC